MPSSAHATGRRPLADRAHALVVVRLHGGMLSEQRAEPALGLDGDAVLGESPGLVLVPLVPDRLRQVLDEVAAARDV